LRPALFSGQIEPESLKNFAAQLKEGEKPKGIAPSIFFAVTFYRRF